MMRNIVFLIIVFLIPKGVSAAGEEQVTDGPSVRYGHTMIAIDSSLYVFGGISEQDTVLGKPLSVYFNDTWKYSAVENIWQKEASLNSLPPARAFHESVVVDGKIIVVFGEYATGVLNCMWQYDPETQIWQKLPSNGTDKPGPRKNFSAVATPDGLLITGGVNYDGVFQQDNWLYDMHTGIWEKKEAPDAAHISYGMTSQMLNERIYSFGGIIEGAVEYNREIMMYNRVQNNWTSFLPSNLPEGWEGIGFPISARTSDSKMIIGGGLVNQAQPTVSSNWYQFDANNHSFTQITDGPALYHSASASLGDKVYVFGGKTADDHVVNDLYRYTAETEFWELMQANTTSIADFSQHVEFFKLQQNYPNPFNPETKIRFIIPQNEKVTLTIHNTLGQKVATLINGEEMHLGTYEETFNANQLTAGIYFYRITMGDYTAVKKMVILK